MLTPRLLLLSNSVQHGFEYLDYALDNIQTFLKKYDVRKLLYVPYAVTGCKGVSRVKDKFQSLGIDVESIHEKPDAIEAVNEAEAIYIGGGNTFLLLKTLYEKNLIEPIRTRVLRDGIPYMGVSAGSNVATRSICTTNDMPIVYPPSYDALKLVLFNINPHYVDPDMNSTHHGETREERINEFHEHCEVPVLGLREGCILYVEGTTGILQGITGAKLFQKDKEALCFNPGDDMSFLLKD